MHGATRVHSSNQDIRWHNPQAGRSTPDPVEQRSHLVQMGGIDRGGYPNRGRVVERGHHYSLPHG
ncbi:hypothetical protein Rhe02_49120 [Rhizocola hellebori]|uniref:Uncharacterized protein n=1 Tax=Rhizocola hellebori TaxID=1392758 RepID=A0A8J3QC34_9ACTN|nr:hypothetical protein Rhe02_49120 [Rhizocola hellebori]